MAFTKSIICLLALTFCSVSAIDVLPFNITVERQLDILPEENPEDIIDLTAVHQDIAASQSSTTEDAQFSVEKYQTGFARLVKVGVKVQKGTRGKLRFRIRARGVDSETIASSDSSYSEYISNSFSEQAFSSYEALKKNFRGSLNIPFLDFLGFNLNKKFTTKEALSTYDSYGETNYNSLSSEATKILDTFTKTKVTISGSVEAVGVSFIPTSAFAFLKFARVEFGEAQSTNVFSSSTEDLVTATSSGKPIPSENGDIEILTPIRR